MNSVWEQSPRRRSLWTEFCYDRVPIDMDTGNTGPGVVTMIYLRLGFGQ